MKLHCLVSQLNSFIDSYCLSAFVQFRFISNRLHFPDCLHSLCAKQSSDNLCPMSLLLFEFYQVSAVAVVEGWPTLLDDTHPYRLFSGFYGQGSRRTDVCVRALSSTVRLRLKRHTVQFTQKLINSLWSCTELASLLIVPFLCKLLNSTAFL